MSEIVWEQSNNSKTLVGDVGHGRWHIEPSPDHCTICYCSPGGDPAITHANLRAASLTEAKLAVATIEHEAAISRSDAIGRMQAIGFVLPDDPDGNSVFPQRSGEFIFRHIKTETLGEWTTSRYAPYKGASWYDILSATYEFIDHDQSKQQTIWPPSVGDPVAVVTRAVLEIVQQRIQAGIRHRPLP